MGESVRAKMLLSSSKRRIMDGAAMENKCLEHSRMAPDVLFEGEGLPMTDSLNLRGRDTKQRQEKLLLLHA